MGPPVRVRVRVGQVGVGVVLVVLVLPNYLHVGSMQRGRGED